MMELSRLFSTDKDSYFKPVKGAIMLKNTLLSMAHNESVRKFVMSNRTTRGVSQRFVAGEELSEALAATKVLNQRGLHVTLDYLGENVAAEQEARASARSYQEILTRIHDSSADANISLKLTALGLDISRELCDENLTRILEHAAQFPLFVRIDMEGSAYTERTMDITLRLHERFEHVGTVIQSCLYRSKKDVEQLIIQGVRVRLVKGAYKEPKSVAFQVKSDVDRNYVRLMTLLLQRGSYPALATHDEAIIDAACKFARNNGISPRAFEFQMLYGIRRDLQEKLVEQGYNVRIYVPYGSQWYPYLMRRMAERPANLIFVARNAVRR
jgi:proline dehydrogenase